MKWLVFSYSLPAKLSASSRVRIWRKLQKSGAVAPKSGIYVLPYTDECVETAQWLAAEVEQEQGEVLLMQVDHFENIPDDKVIDIFQKERIADYQAIEGFLAELETLIQEARNTQNKENVVVFKRDINKLKRNIDDVARVDFFPAYDRRVLVERLRHLQRTLVTGNLILLVLFSLGSMNGTVLRKLKEECVDVPRKQIVKLKPANTKRGLAL